MNGLLQLSLPQLAYVVTLGLPTQRLLVGATKRGAVVAMRWVLPLRAIGETVFQPGLLTSAAPRLARLGHEDKRPSRCSPENADDGADAEAARLCITR